MGGDDLGDDDYLVATTVGGDGAASDSEDESVTNDYTAASSSSQKKKTNKKRQHDELYNDSSAAHGTVSDDDDDDGNDDSNKKAKLMSKKEHLRILQLAHDLEYSTSEVQAKFLTKWMSNQISTNDNDGGNNDEEKIKFVQNQFMVPNSTSSNKVSDMNSLGERLSNTISKKKFKQWNKKHSPLVLIVCLSARRAVSILKDLSSSDSGSGCNYKFGIAKLFAKHLTVEQQTNMLSNTSYPIAIGTPHRLLALLSTPNTENPNLSDTALSLKHTQLVVLDCHPNIKNYTVCTLPDTAPHVKELIQNYIQPQMNRVKAMKNDGNPGDDKSLSKKALKRLNKKNKGNINGSDSNLRLAFF